MTTRRQQLVRALIVLAMVAALVLFARAVNWAETWRAIRSTSLSLLAAAAAVNLLSLVLKGVRWWVFLRPIGVSSLGLTMRATFAGAALNNVLVANSGDAGRIILVSRAAHVASERVLATLALERLFELVGYVILFAAAVSFLELPPSIAGLRPVAIVALLVMALLLGYLLRHPPQADAPPVAGVGLLHRAKQYGRGFVATLTGISTGPRFAASLGLSVIVWALQVATYQLTARAAHFEISIVGTIAAILAVNTGFAARATPGNIGVFQMMYAMTTAAFGMDKDQATGVALLIQMQQILPVTILGVVASPGIFTARRRKTARPDNILPGEPASFLER
jgi:uncharacterized membrane protein YbhN (UPF0104 family)